MTGRVIGCACLLLAVATVPKPFVDEDRYRIRAGDFEMVLLPLRRHPAVVSASYSAQSGSNQIRLALVRQEDFDRAQGNPSKLAEETLMASTPRGKSGSFTHRVAHRGDYLILVDNRADKDNAAVVQVRVAWEYPRVTQLSPERQFTVIAISFLAFFSVVTYSARKLLKAARG